MIVEHYKECSKYLSKLEDYVARAYLTCLDEVTLAVTKKGFKVIVFILTELMRSLVL